MNTSLVSQPATQPVQEEHPQFNGLPPEEAFSLTNPRRKDFPLPRRDVNDPIKVQAIYHQVAQLAVLGTTQKQIAELLGLTQNRVCILLQSAAMQPLLRHKERQRDEIMQAQAQEILCASQEALTVLREQVINNPEAPLALRAKHAESMLDRAGFGAVQKSQSQVIHGHFSTAEIEELKRRALEAGMPLVEED